MAQENSSSYDALYIPFPSFKDWSSLMVDNQSWERAKNLINEQLENLETYTLESISREITRMAAYDTGALENLYETDRGITRTFAEFSGVFESSFLVDGEEKSHFELVDSQLAAYNLTIDAVTNKVPLSEAWIREIHRTICASQENYRVQTPRGYQEQYLPKGEYKKQPNHVLLRDGTVFAYAPVHETAIEMHRLLEELRTAEFDKAHPVLKAAYAHYAFVRIHPFSDGNGRVSRVLASLYLFRDASIPLLIFSDQRNDYLSALRSADLGNPQAFVDLIFDSSIEALGFQKLYIEANQMPSISESINNIQDARKLRRFTPSFLDSLAQELLSICEASFRKLIQNANWPSAVVTVSVRRNNQKIQKSNFPSISDKSFRVALFNPASNHVPVIELGLIFKPDKSVRNYRVISVFIAEEDSENPKLKLGDESSQLDLRAHDVQNNGRNLQLKIDLWAEGFFRKMLTDFQSALDNGLS